MAQRVRRDVLVSSQARPRAGLAQYAPGGLAREGASKGVEEDLRHAPALGRQDGPCLDEVGVQRVPGILAHRHDAFLAALAKQPDAA